MITLAELKGFLNITEVTHDDALGRIIDAATGEINKYCNRKLLDEQYEEIYQGKDKNYLYLNNYPVTAVTEIKYRDVDGAWIDLISSNVFNSIVELPTDEAKRILTLLGGYKFPPDYSYRSNIKVKYQAGYKSVLRTISNYKVLTGLLQLCNNVASVTEQENTIGNVIWSTTDEYGCLSYQLTLAGAFPLGKVYAPELVFIDDDDSLQYTGRFTRLSDDVWDLIIWNPAGEVTSNVNVANLPFEIRVYSAITEDESESTAPDLPEIFKQKCKEICKKLFNYSNLEGSEKTLGYQSKSEGGLVNTTTVFKDINMSVLDSERRWNI